jgi:hypothetical protein
MGVHMASEVGANSRRRRRRLRAALVLLRRRMVKGCKQMQSAGGFYDDVARNLGPVLSEFSDILPAGARESLSKVNSLVQERRADLDTACKLCKGEVKNAIKDVSSRLGVEGRIREALSPLENLAPQWLVASPLAQLVVAAVVVLVGGGTVAAVGGAMVSGGGETEPPHAVAASPNGDVSEADAGTEADEAAARGLPAACDLVLVSQVESFFGGDAEVNSNNGSDYSMCGFAPVDGSCQDAGILLTTTKPGNLDGSENTIAGLGDEAYYHDYQVTLYVRQDEFWLSVTVNSEPPECFNNIEPEHTERMRAESVELTRSALASLP